MKVFVSENEGFVELNVEDFSSPLSMAQDIESALKNENDPLIDSINMHLNFENINKIVANEPNFEIYDEGENYVELKFNVINK